MMATTLLLEPLYNSTWNGILCDLEWHTCSTTVFCLFLVCQITTFPLFDLPSRGPDGSSLMYCERCPEGKRLLLSAKLNPNRSMIVANVMFRIGKLIYYRLTINLPEDGLTFFTINSTNIKESNLKQKGENKRRGAAGKRRIGKKPRRNHERGRQASIDKIEHRQNSVQEKNLQDNLKAWKNLGVVPNSHLKVTEKKRRMRKPRRLSERFPV